MASASGMNSPGSTSPRSGWFQRTSASTPVKRPVRKVELRLVVQHELAPLQRQAQLALEPPTRLRLLVHARLEEAEPVRGPAALAR